MVRPNGHMPSYGLTAKRAVDINSRKGQLCSKGDKRQPFAIGKFAGIAAGTATLSGKVPKRLFWDSRTVWLTQIHTASAVRKVW